AVFCEKPPAVTPEQLERLRAAVAETPGPLMVGFNRRFAPLAAELKPAVTGRGALSVTYRVNAGTIPPEHWLNDPAEGGRIIGEACHFFDFFGYLTDSRPTDLARLSPEGVRRYDDGQFLVRYADGSVCHLMYVTTGSPGLGKERVEVHAGGASAVLEDFRVLDVLEPSGKRRRHRLWNADKGHRAMLEAWLRAVREGRPLVPPDELLQTAALTLAAAQGFSSEVSMEPTEHTDE
ncbi:MAG: Gfo/Idh/MocA family protein, partial [Thermogutta sp.]